MISILAGDLSKSTEREGTVRQSFSHFPDSDAFTSISAQSARHIVPGALFFTDREDPIDVANIGAPGDQVRLIARLKEGSNAQSDQRSNRSGRWTVEGYVLSEGRWQERPVQIVPLREDLFSRARGILDTPVISDARVLGVGLGSVGSVVPEDLSTCGVMNFTLIDDDRVTVGNLARGNFYVDDVGRFKTKVVAERIRGKNPFASVETYEVRISWETQEFLRDRVRQNDIVIGAVDNRKARIIINKVCVEEKKPVIFMGASHRACMVQILFVSEPGVSPCYQCFLMSLPAGQKEGGLRDADLPPYAVRPVTQFEPGLGVDIAAMNTMVSKVCAQKLLEGKATALRSLDKDLIAPLLIYVNRREGPYEKLEPLGFRVGDGMSILSWYGIDLKRNPACPVCGDYEGETTKSLGI
jgi:molybdopterin/thiamine biosynthesis adenylyltransferase